MSDLGMILGIFGGMAMFAVVLLIAAYVISALGNMRVLQYFNHTYPWLAFIPYGNMVALTQCMRTDEEGNVKIFGKAIKKDIFQWWALITIVCGFIPVIGTILVIAINLIAGGHVYKDLLSAESGQDETVMGIICAIIPIVWLILCFTKFKKKL